MAAPTFGPLTSSTSIEIVWTGLTLQDDIGGTPLLSYLLEVDSGSGFTPLVGSSSPYLSLSYLMTTNIVPGSSYTFRISA